MKKTDLYNSWGSTDVGTYTDHIAFLCPKCGSAMEVAGVKTMKSVPSCYKKTEIWVDCKHHGRARIKFYWKGEHRSTCQKITQPVEP